MTNGQVAYTYSVHTLDKGMIPVPGGTEQHSTSFHHSTQDGVQFKTYELFISSFFHLIFLYQGWSLLTETVDEGGTTV